MLNKQNAIRIEKHKNNKLFIFNCEICYSEMRVQQQFIPKHSGLCVRCAQFDKPFKAPYSSLVKSAKNRNQEMSISYEQFLKFTEINKCNYCNSHIEWYPHTSKDKEIGKHTRSYKLDRKDSNIGYTIENCVVCCWKCNSSKNNRFTYDEWFGMTEYFRNKL